jgi:calcineurin-like phosphoesterase family protein
MMANVFFIGDTHFGHRKLLDMEPLRKAFADTIEEHDEKIVNNWNNIVRSKDVVYHLGDVSLGNTKVLCRLNGYKKLILGNHDKETQLGAHFDRVFGAFSLGEFILTHIPVHPQQLEFRFKRNIHGHLHKANVMHHKPWQERKDERYINVSCEQINFTPIEYDELR